MTPSAGRPARIADERTRGGDTGPDLRVRVAWLARSSRCASPQPDLRRQTSFARRLSALDINASPTRISMWENGHQALSLEALAGYERLLGLPAASLQATAAALARDHRGRGRAPLARARPAPTDPAEGQRSLDAVYDNASRGTCTGGDWFALADHWLRVPTALTPVVVVRRLASTLVDELSRSCGAAYVTRFEALCRLAEHPVYSSVVVESVLGFVDVPGADAVIDVLAVLGECPPGALPDILDLAHQRGGRVRVGAVSAVCRQLASGRLSESQLTGVGALVDHLAVGEEGAVRLAREVLGQMPAAERRRLRPGLPERVEPPPPPPSSGAILGRYVETARTMTGLPQDPVLRRLLQELHTAEDPRARHQAALLLQAGPYRHALATEALEVLLTRTGTRDADVAGRLLTYLATAEQTEQLTRRVTGSPPAVVRVLLLALAHGGGLPPHVDLASVAVEPSLYGPTIYSAGMSGHPQLDAWSQRLTDATLRERAQWWLRRGPAVRD